MRSINYTTRYLALILLVLLTQGFTAHAQQLSYHGRIVDSVTNLGVTGNVDFRIQVRTGSSATDNCIMYEETQTKSLNNGVFVIGINNGVGTRVDTTGYTLAQIFSNKNPFGSFNLPSAGCNLGAPLVYTPAATDGRRVNILFHDPLTMVPGTWEPLPTQTVAYVPAALESQNVGGFPSDSLLRVVNGATPFNVSPLSNAQYTELMALIGGTTSQYLLATNPAVGFTGALTGDVTGTQGATTVGRIRGTTVSAVAPANGQILKMVGGVWTPAADDDSLGTVTSVTSANAYLSVSPSATAPVITLNVGTVANTVAAGDDPRIVGAVQGGGAAGGDLSGTYPNPSVATVGGRTAAEINTSVTDTLAGTSLNTVSTIVKRDGLGNSSFTTAQATNFSGRNLYLFDAANTNSIQMRAPNVFGANYVLTFPVDDGGVGEVLGTDGAGNLAWVSPTAGAVTSVGATAPLASTGGSTPNISMPVATTAQDGYLASTDWNTFNNKLTSVLATGQVFIGDGANVATARNFLNTDIKSSVAGNWFNVAGACAAGQTLTYSAVSDSVACAAYAITSGQVTTALGYTPTSDALASGNFYVGNAGGVAAGVAMSGDAALSNTGAVTIVNDAITTAKVNNLAITDAKINDVAWGKVTATPTTIAGYGITDAILTNAGGVVSAQAGTFAAMPAFGTAGRVYITTDTQEIYRDDGTAWVKVGSAVGLGGTVTNVTGTAPINVATGTTTPVISMPAAATAQDGYLTSANWNTFNNKLTSVLATGQVFIGDGANVATARNFLNSDIKSSVAGNWFNVAGACAAGQTLTYSAVNDNVTCTAYSITSGQVTTALGYTPASDALASGNIFVGNAGGTAAGVAMSGDATISNTGVLTLADTAVTAGANYTKFTVDSKGRITAASNISAGDVTTALTFTPLNKAGDTMSGTLTMGAPIVMGGFDVSGVGNFSMATNKTFMLSHVTPAEETALTGTLVAADKGKTWFNSTTNTIMYWDGSAAQALASAAGAISTLNGLTTTTQSFATNTGGTDFNIVSAGSTHTFNIPTASATNRGLLSSADWSTFNSQLPSTLNSAQIFVGSAANVATGRALSGDATISNTGVLTFANTGVTAGAGYTKFSVDAKGRVTVGGYINATDVNTALGFTPVSNALATGNIFVGDGSNVAAGVPMSGDAAITSAGALTLANTAVTAGTYGTASAVPSFTVDSKGRLTAASAQAYQDANGAAKGIVQIGSNIDVAAGVISLTGTNVTNALGYTPATSALPSSQIFVGNAGGVATAVAMSGDATISNAGALTIGAGAITTGKLDNLAVTNAKINDVAWGKVTATPTTIAGYGITDAILTNAGGVVSAQAGTFATRPAFGTAGRVYISTDTQEIYRDDGTAWVLVGSAIGLGGTVTNVTGTAPINVATGTTTPVISMPAATVAQDGYLTAADFVTFNNKISPTLNSAQILVGSAGNVATAVSMSGDATLSNTGALTLANSGATAGSGYTKFSVDGKGRVTVGGYINATDVNTALGFTPISDAVASGNMLIGNAGGVATSVAMSGDATISNAGALTLANTAVTAATYGSAQQVSQVTVDSKGRVTGASNVTIDDTTKLPLAGGTMTGSIAMGSNNITGTGNILMSANRSLGLSNLTAAEQTALVGTLVAGDKGRTWFNSTTNTVMYWDGSAEQALGIAGSGVTNLNGLTGSTQSFALGTAGTDVGISSAGVTHTFNFPSSSSANRGLLTAADWTTFNNKISPTLNSAQILVGSAGNVATAVSMSGDATLSNTGALTLANSGATAGSGYTKVTVDAKGRVTVGGYINATDVNTALGFTPITDALASGNMLIGNAGGVATAVAMSGDATISNAGALTLANTAVTAATYGSAQQVSQVTVDSKGRVTGASNVTIDDTTKLPLAGGTMTGNLNMSSNRNMMMGNYTNAQETTLTGT
ncbi:MAG: hypothetical protein A2622_06930, partial [Bdellovibrionales bacterium RIFCSPHIGHO2_01_FULL_40_29]